MDSRHQETASLVSSNYIIFHFSQKTSIELKIHKKSVDAVQDSRQQIEGFRDRPQIKRFSEGMNILQIRAEIEYITDMAKIMEYGIMSTPALMVDNKVVSMGRVLKAKEVAKML